MIVMKRLGINVYTIDLFVILRHHSVNVLSTDLQMMYWLLILRLLVGRHNNLYHRRFFFSLLYRQQQAPTLKSISNYTSMHQIITDIMNRLLLALLKLSRAEDERDW